MGSYNFTFKDVLKRHERMINRVEQWEIHALAIIMLVVTAFFTLSTFCFASEVEEVTPTIVNGLTISGDRNYFAPGQSYDSLGYIQLERGYIYHFTSSTSYKHYLAFSDAIPENNGTYSYIGYVNNYDFISNDNDYLYFDFYNEVGVTITRERITGYSGVVGDLVDNVGVSQLWDTFGSGIDFIYIVVIVGFGIFLIALAIRKISKGKSEI